VRLAQNMRHHERQPDRDGAPGAERRKKSLPGRPMTLGGAVAAGVRIVVWCRGCSHQVEPDPSELSRRYGDKTSVLDWRERLVCSHCGSHAVDMVLTGANSRNDEIVS